jgi:hypothetical protein
MLNNIQNLTKNQAKWLQHYNKLIVKAIYRTPPSVTERHHIIPKCMGGSNSKDNLVKLTPSEHYIAHQLLVKIFPTNSKILYAAHIMGNTRSNKEYEWLRTKFIISVSGPNNYMYGVPKTAEHRTKISQTLTGKYTGVNSSSYGKPGTRTGIPHTKETKQKMSKSMKGKNCNKVRTVEFKQNLSKLNSGTGNHFYGKSHSLESIQKMKNSHNIRPKLQCPYCNIIGGNVLKRWHFDNCKLKPSFP